MEAINFSTSLDIELNQQVTYDPRTSQLRHIKHRSRTWLYYISLFIIGQVYCGIYSFSGMLVTSLSNHKANLPFLNQLVQCSMQLAVAKFMKPRNTESISLSDYLVPSISDSLCLVLNQLAYGSTSMASNDLMNTFSIVVTTGLSIWVLKLKYSWAHYSGIAFTLIGMVVVYISDSQKGGFSVGDLLGLASSASSAVSAIAQERLFTNGIEMPEYLLKTNRIELLIAIVGLVTSEYELIIAGHFNWMVILEILAYGLGNLAIVMLMLLIVQKYGATSFTLISLFSVVYSTLFDVFLFGKPFHFSEVIGYASIITGVVVFHLREPETSKKDPLLGSL